MMQQFVNIMNNITLLCRSKCSRIRNVLAL